jgi:putative glutamine amidotransferase
VAAAPLAAGRVSGWTDSSEAVQSQYLGGLRRAGAIPVALGGPLEADPAALLARFAGLMLMGGPDVDPACYGEAAHREVYGIDARRDAFELDLIRAAVAARLPLFGICRGIQVLNVAFGGTLWQHLGDLNLSVAHGVPVGAGVAATHDVEGCISIHHQAVREVAPALVATAWSADGLVEALETPADGPWCVAVQWHPERAAELEAVQQGLFDGFVAAACGQ